MIDKVTEGTRRRRCLARGAEVKLEQLRLTMGFHGVDRRDFMGLPAQTQACMRERLGEEMKERSGSGWRWRWHGAGMAMWN